MNKANFPGISPLARETTQNFLTAQQKVLKTQNTSLRILCIILFVATCFNGMYAILLVYKNSLVLEENLQLIRENRALIAIQYQQFMLKGFLSTAGDWSSDNQDDDDDNKIKTNNLDVEKFARMIDIRLPRADCPPCTTEKPSVVQPHKNPVSILNELTHFAKYDCEHQCLNPPIHFSRLNVTDPRFPEKKFTGKGESKQKSKQVAAYMALKFFFPENLDEVAEEYKPDLEYSPVCSDRIVLPTGPTNC